MDIEAYMVRLRAAVAWTGMAVESAGDLTSLNKRLSAVQRRLAAAANEITAGRGEAAMNSLGVPWSKGCYARIMDCCREVSSIGIDANSSPGKLKEWKLVPQKRQQALSDDYADARAKQLERERELDQDDAQEGDDEI